MNEREAMLGEFKRIRLASTVGALTIDGYRNALAQCRELAEAAIRLFEDDEPEVCGRVFRRSALSPETE